MSGISCECGAVLVEEVTSTGVRPRGASEPIIFRRVTDHVVCDACFASYDARELLKRASGEESEALSSMIDRMT